MGTMRRRDLLKMAAALAAGAGLAPLEAPVIAAGLDKIADRRTRVLWLQAMSCSGCSISLLNADHPGPLEILTELISLVFHPNLSATQGPQAMETIDKAAAEKDYLLVLEGAIPVAMPEACIIGGRPITSMLPPLLREAKAIVAVGTCTAFGGVPAGEGSPTGAVGLKDFMIREKIPYQGRLVNCPGCPTHPECLLTTLAYLAATGTVKVHPELLTPTALFSHSVHDECPRFHAWEKLEFAEKFGDEGCLFKLGCLGPLSHTMCARRQWNGGVNWCIRAGAPCIGCTSEQFARRRDFPFYRKGEEHHAVVYNESDRQGK
jgi:hydrogenase small subunit